MAEQKISVVIITKNEEKHIEECLESVQWADEIIVVDSFSTDATVEICRKYTDKVFQREWTGFADQKNYGIELSGCPWVLSIDADERITPALKEEITKAMQNDRFAGYYIPRKNYLNSRWMRYAAQYPDYQLRLFRNTARFDGREVHERVTVNGPVGYLKEPMVHCTYQNLDQFVEKINKYTCLEAVERLKKNRDIPIYLFLYLPLRKFFSLYIYRKGYKDGVLGLIISGLAAFYVFLELAKAWEKKNLTN
ncbi:glycosyltransferase family 2 protein [Thermincola potens]|uniref:Glycosyl transferase family 2 n=1 Tax=Thermincola potens (strain JR) TaxID=635013 RepID=D5XD02_THEPJ|nr:glycosyltransferase family 2 protein [Thermincola potens]ADG83678.1 glycosyl transferase family 2 [Thermincola potens JR]